MEVLPCKVDKCLMLPVCQHKEKIYCQRLIEFIQINQKDKVDGSEIIKKIKPVLPNISSVHKKDDSYYLIGIPL